MFTTIGALLAGAAAGPAGAQAPEPVRRGSHLAGRCEGLVWRAISRPEVGRILLAAKRYERAGRRRGQRRGPLGHVGLEVLELLGHLVRHKTGRLEPSLDYLMHKLRRSRAAVVRALAALRAHGFLDWLRRYAPTGQEGPGPRRRQVSNAYRLLLPARAARLLGVLSQPAPLPDDVLQAQELRAQETAAHKASLPLGELARLEVADHRLGRLLASLGQAVEQRAQAQGRTRPERESAQRSESQFGEIT